VVRAGRGAPHPLLWREAARQAGDGGALQRLLHAQRRQQPGEALRQHGLARAGRPHQQQPVAARGGDLQRAPGGGLTLHVGQVGARGLGRGRGGLQGVPAAAVAVRRRAARGQELAHHVQQVRGAVDGRAGHQRGLLRALRRQHQARAFVLAAQRQRRGQRAAHRAQLARQRQLARELPAREPRRVDLPAGREQAQGDGQVEAPRVLGQVGRGEVDGRGRCSLMGMYRVAFPNEVVIQLYLVQEE